MTPSFTKRSATSRRDAAGLTRPRVHRWLRGHAWQHLLLEQHHRALPGRPRAPLVGDHEKRAEPSYLVAELRQPGGDRVGIADDPDVVERSEEHTSELQSPCNLVCRLLLEKKKNELDAHPLDMLKFRWKSLTKT